MKCVICHKEIERHGCNPWPLVTKGQCCEICDREKVIPARLALSGINLTAEQIQEMISAEDQMKERLYKERA